MYLFFGLIYLNDYAKNNLADNKSTKFLIRYKSTDL